MNEEIIIDTLEEAKDDEEKEIRAKSRANVAKNIKRKNFNTDGILTHVYPIVAKALDNRFNQWRQCVSEFIKVRAEILYDTAPCVRIYKIKDPEDMFAALGISESQIMEGIHQTYYWSMDRFKPRHAKDPLSIIALCAVRYFMLKKDQKNLDLAMIYQAFSNKYYPSIHYSSFPQVAPAKYRYIMEYVVNNRLTQKFELKEHGNIIRAIKATNTTWLESYKDLMTRFEDEDITYMMQQLHNRIKSFMKNIAKEYYEAFKNKEYLTYDKDSLPEDEGVGRFHLTVNDSFKLQQYVENTMTKIGTSQVDYKACKMASDANVKTEEVRSIFEAILNKQENLNLVKEYITGMVASYLVQSENKDVTTMTFFKHSISVKPNTKDPTVIRMKEIIETLLDDNSIAYRKRKHRVATKSSYHKAFSTFIAINIITANK